MARATRSVTPVDDELDLSLLSGFTFSCRPGCGLCCFATPAVSPTERPVLLEIAPRVRLTPGRDGFAFIEGREHGGACTLLEGLRCSAHAARPFPCRTYPVTVHLGGRAQATLVLSCPGVPLEGLVAGPTPAEGPQGLDLELRAVAAEIRTTAAGDRWAAARRDIARAVRSLRRLGVDPVIPPVQRSQLDRALADSARAPVAPRPPRPEDGWEALPLTFLENDGRVGLADSDSGWAVIPFSEEGASPGPWSRYEPAWPPPRTPAAERLLRGYLEYVARRDAFGGYVLWSLLDQPGGSSEDRLGEELARVVDEVLARGAVLKMAAGVPDVRLDVPDISAGIRAFDAELLDRPTLGRTL